MKVVTIEFIEQLIDSMSDAVSKLEKALLEKRTDDVNKLKVFIFDLHNQISVSLGGKNV